MHDFKYSQICSSEHEFKEAMKSGMATVITVNFCFDEEFIHKRVRSTHNINTLCLQYHHAVGVITRPGINRLCVKWPRLRTLVVHEKDRKEVSKLAREVTQLTVISENWNCEFDVMKMPI